MKTVGEHKITHGFVRQVFRDGRCVEQSFTAGDPVEWEDENGNPIPEPKHLDVYQPFDMIHPNRVAWRCPECGDELSVSDWDYGTMADSGGPICGKCDCDYEYIPEGA